MTNEIRQSWREDSCYKFNYLEDRVHRRVKYPVWEIFRDIQFYLETKIQSSHANTPNDTLGD